MEFNNFALFSISKNNSLLSTAEKGRTLAVQPVHSQFPFLRLRSGKDFFIRIRTFRMKKCLASVTVKHSQMGPFIMKKCLASVTVKHTQMGTFIMKKCLASVTVKHSQMGTFIMKKCLASVTVKHSQMGTFIMKKCLASVTVKHSQMVRQILFTLDTFTLF